MKIFQVINTLIDMKNLLTALLILGIFSAQAQLWVEDFSAEANGDISGTAGGTIGGTWSRTQAPSSGTFAKGTFLGAETFQVNNTGAQEGVFETNAINISTVGYAIINIGVTVGGLGFSAADYLRFYYKLDGGPEILFADISGSLLSITTEASAIVAANTVQIVVRGRDNSGLGIILFDNVTITAAPITYSRKSGAWTDASGTGTWSLVSHTGAACSCYPLNTQVAVIGNNHTVTIGATSQTAVGTPPTLNLAPGAVDVQNTGTLQFDNSSVTLGVQAGLFRVRNGGTVNSSSGAITGEVIQFQADVGGARLQVDAGGSLAIEDLVLSTAATNTHFLEGGSAITISDDVQILADGATLTNNMTTLVTITDRIEFAAGTTGSGFVNNGTIAATTLFFDDDNNAFTNSGTATFSGNITANGNGDDNTTVTNNATGILNFVNLDGDAAASSGDGGDMTILNSGTINQTGTFVDIPNNTNASNDVNNLAGSTWNYSGTGHDTNVRLFANNPTNTFNYNLSGAQQIITPIDAYHNLSLTSGSAAAKNALGSFSVSGNYTRSGLATFSPSGTTLTLNGTTSAQTISAVGGETFASLTINNTFATAPQIIFNEDARVNTTLTMTSGIINLSGTTFTLGVGGSASTLSRAASTTTNWMYNGTFRRFWVASTAVTNTNYGLFPLGASGASSYRPALISSTVSPTATVSVSVTHYDNAGVTDLSPTFNDGGTTIVRKLKAQHDITTSNTTAGGTYNMGITMTGLLAGTLSDIRLGVSNGAPTITTVGTHAGATGTAPNPTANRTGLSLTDLTGDFRITTANSVATPLPVELVDFNASVTTDGIQLKWRTLTEINNDFFEVQRSKTGEQFTPLAKKKGAGTTTVPIQYNYLDTEAKEGKTYYRLKQVDFSGESTYSDIISVDYQQSDEFQMLVYPNPAQGKSFTLAVSGLGDLSTLPVFVTDLIGRAVHSSNLNVINGSASGDFFTENLPNGIYLIKVGTSNLAVKRIMVNH